MSITKEQKIEIVKDLKDRFLRSKSIVFLSFNKMTVNEDVELRKKFRNENIDYKVAKKTLIKICLRKSNIDIPDDFVIEGPMSLAIGYDNEVAPAKVASEYSKTNKKIKLACGFVSGKYLNCDEINALALLPDKTQLRAQFIGVINAPLYGLVNVLSGNIRKFIYVIKNISDKNQ